MFMELKWIKTLHVLVHLHHGALSPSENCHKYNIVYEAGT